MQARWLGIVLGALVAGSGAAACGGGSDQAADAPLADAGIAPNCNPLGVSHCMVPWPSSAFEVADPTSATGRRLAIPAGTLPKNIAQAAIDPTPWNAADGFSPAAPIVMAFPGGVSADGLPPNTDFSGSTGSDSATVLIDMTTGERVAHFAEIDMQATATPDSQALFIRPAARLVGGHRYAVAITKKVKAAGGGDLPVPPGFTALVNGTPSTHPLLEAMRPRFPDVLAALQTAGYAPSDLVVAWDFTVASDDFIHRDMIAVRDRTIAALANHPIAYTITTDGSDGSGAIERKITGTFDAPLFLSDGGSFDAGVTIVRDADGLPAVQGFYQIPFVATVPACAATAGGPIGMLVYGHGLMGTSDETAYGVQEETAQEVCRVFVGTDMRGMSTNDLPAVAGALNDANTADEVFEKLEQGLANQIALAQALHTTFASQLFVDGSGASIVKADDVTYYGLSQGSILGTAVMAYEPTILRAVLGVGGANYSTLLERSADWPTYRTILHNSYTDNLDDTLLVNLMQMRWDKVEGSGIANSVLDGTATGVPAKQILMQIALGDDQVPNLGSYWQARTMGIPVLTPTTAMPWGLDTAPSPLAVGASAIVIEDGGVAPPPVTNVPAPSTGQHDLTRDQPASRRQMKELYDHGDIVNECAGACTCATGACD